MRNTILVVISFVVTVLASASAGAEPPAVSDVAASQRTDASKLVDISYKVSDPDSTTVGVRLKVSTDGGSTYNFLPVSVSGDVGENVAVTPVPTQKHIVWDAGADMPYTFGQNFRAAVTAHDCVGYTGEMITIPAGSFLMGNNGHEGYSNSEELPQHEVYLSEYQIGKYEVTRGEYHRFILAGGYENPACWSAEGWAWRAANNRSEPDYWASIQDWGNPPGAFPQTDRHPVVGVTHYEAQAFCNWATACLPEPERSRPFHLPTEAQWEKASRWVASTATPLTWAWGDVWDLSRCNSLDDLVFPGYQTAPVGSYISPSGESPYGCADMTGNVWEWCKDWYDSGYYNQTPPGGWTDPDGPSTGAQRVVRGGSWEHADYNCRCSRRHLNDPHESWRCLGLRPAR